MSTNTGNSIIPTDAEHDAHYCTRGCLTCGQVMTHADREAEKEEQDDLCESCRRFIDTLREEAAVADFLEGITASRPQPYMEAWFTQVIDACKMQFKSRFPISPDEVCQNLIYESGKLRLVLKNPMNGACELRRLNEMWQTPEWVIPFTVNVPASVILAAIDAAIETSK